MQKKICATGRISNGIPSADLVQVSFMSDRATIEIVADDKSLCGEGPIWDPRGKRLLWNDLSSSLVYQYDPATRAKSIISRDLMIAGIALNRDESRPLVVAGATGVHVWEGQGKYRTVATQHAGDTLFCNDMIADARGRVYVGTCYWGADGMEKLGKLMLIDPDGSTRVADDGIELANGLGFSPNDRTLYFTDSTARKIYAYDVDGKSGGLSRKRVFVTVSTSEGIPDGMTVDRDGFVWSAQWYGSQVVRYDPDGKVERRIPMPVQQISSCTFGGKDLIDLYVTSAADSWKSSYAPPNYNFDAPNIGGALYRVRVGDGVQGRAEHFANFK